MKIQTLVLALICLVCSQGISEELDENLLKRFESYAQKSFEEWQVPGMAVGIVKDGKVAFAKGFGVRELGGNEKVNENTIFQIGSLSKAFTAALTAIAVEQGKFKWDDKVVDHLPDFMLFDPWVTRQFEVEDLLAQRSGLPAYAGDQQVNLGFNGKEMIEHLRFIEPVTSFRSTFAYQNIFFLIAGELLGKITNKSWQELLTQELLNSLQMQDTTVGLDPFFNAPNFANLHERGLNGKVRLLGRNYPYNAGVYVFAPAGGINSNVVDMCKWMQFLLNQGKIGDRALISDKNLKRMFSPHTTGSEYEEAYNYYCLGWIYRENNPYPIIWHNGGTAGVNNMLGLIPQENLGIIVFCNTRGTLLAEALALEFFDMYFKKQSQDWSQKLLTHLNEENKKALNLFQTTMAAKSSMPSLPLEDYAGSFQNPIYGKAEVIFEKGELVLFLGKDKIKTHLKHLNRDVFTLIWPYVTEDEISPVSFELDQSGKTVFLTIKELQEAKFIKTK